MNENNNSIISNNSSFLSNSSNATNNEFDENLEMIIEKINENLNSKNLFNILLFSKRLIYIMNSNKYSISKYFENYLKISEILLNIKKCFQLIYNNKYFIIDNKKYNINEKIFINLISSSYINDYLSLSYFYIIIGSIILTENNIYLTEILNLIYNSFKNIDLPLSSYFSHNFLLKNFSENNILNIINNESSIEIFNKNIIEMNDIYNNYIYNNKNNKEINEINITLPILLIENINIIFSLNFMNLKIFKKYFINTLLNLIDEKELYNNTILDFIINGLNEKYFVDNLDLIFLKLKNLINKEKNITNKMFKIQERAIKFFDNNNEIKEFENFNNIYDSSIIIIKTENERNNISIKNFLIYIYSLLNFVLYCCKNKKIKEQFNYVNGILILTFNFLNKQKKILLNNNQNLNNEIIKNQIKNDNNIKNENEIDIESIDEKIKKKENLFNEKKKVLEIKEKKNCIFTDECYKLYDNILELLFKTKINIYKLINLLKITNFFDDKNKKLFCKKFIFQLLKKNELDNKSLLINSIDRIDFISILLKSLLNNNFYSMNNENELDIYIQINQIFEMIYHQNPETFLMLLISLSNIFNQIEFYSENLQNLIYSYYKLLLKLVKKIETSFLNKKEFEINENYSTSETDAINNKINRLNSSNLKRINNFELIKNKKRSNSNNNKINNNNNNKNYNNNNKNNIKKIISNNKNKDNYEIDINNYNEQQIIELINNIYILIREKIKNDYKNYSEQNLKCLINAFNQIDNSLILKNSNDLLNDFLSIYLKIIVTKIIDNKKKLSYFIIIINIVAKSKNLNEKNYNNFIKNVNIISKTFQKRIDLIKIEIESLNLYLNNNNLNNKSLINKIINNSIKELEFIMIKKEIIESYVEIISKFNNFFENNKNFIEIEFIDLLIKNINHNLNIIDINNKNTLLVYLNNLNNLKSELKNK